MAQSATGIAPLLKQAWTSDRIQQQYEFKNGPVARLKSIKGTMIGAQAQVPVWNNRSFAYTSTGAAGGSLNPAQQQQVTQATYSLVYSWFQIALEASALMQATGSNVQSIIAAKDLEIRGAIENMNHQVSRQFVTGGDGIVAACDTGGPSTTVKLLAATAEGASYGLAALLRGWIGPQATVDIGTTGDTDALVTASPISAINMSPSAPTITIGTSISTTAGTHFVYIPNPNSASAANPELNGLRNMINTTGALGGLNPATAGQEFWAAAARDTTTTVMSLDMLLGLGRATKQNSNEEETEMWFGLKQEANYYSLLQNQVRFTGDGNLAAGEVGKAKWNGLVPTMFKDILDTDVFMITPKDLVRITGGMDKPVWASDLQGANTGTLWSQGTTQFGDALIWPQQVGMQQRNTSAAATALTA